MSDMSDEDDDLPVLTQVLRVGSDRAGAGPLRGASDASTGLVAELPLEEILLADQLVIGTEPHVGLEPYIPLTTPLSDRGAADGESLSRSLTSPLIVPFIAPQDTRARSNGGTASDASREAGTGLEQLRAANDAGDALSEREMPMVPVAASLGERAPVDSPTPPPFEHDAFAVRVRESVLNDLSARIDTEFDARIAQTLWAEVEAALASLQANLREQLADAVRDVVRRAVEEEMARLRDKTRGEPRRE